MILDDQMPGTPALPGAGFTLPSLPEPFAVGVVAPDPLAELACIRLLSQPALCLRPVGLSSGGKGSRAAGCVVMVLGRGPDHSAVTGRCAALARKRARRFVCLHETDLADAAKATLHLDVFVFLLATAPAGVVAAAVVLASHMTARVSGTGGAAGPWAEPGTARRPCPPKVLTARQTDVLRLLAKGYSNKAMARSLRLAEPAVKLHLAALRRVLDARNRTEVLGKAMRMGMLPP